MSEHWKELPLFKKAIEIKEIVNHIVSAVEQTDIDFDEAIQKEIIKSHLEYLHKNAMIIPAKIAGVAKDDTPYDLRMENATIIRKAARELITDTRGLDINGYKDEEYLDILRNEIEEFRLLFAEWVKTFDPWNYLIDRWGLFNPPGINYDDPDPEDDIPFNKDDF